MLSSLVSIIEHYGLIGVFFSMMIENLGIPLPTEPGYLVAQTLVTRGVHPLWQVHLVLFAGHTAGSLFSYWAGVRIAKGLKQKKEFNETQQKLAGWFEKYGNLTVFATRLIGFVRPWSSYVAGIAGVKFWPFFILSSLGTIILNIVCMAFSQQFVHLWTHYPAARVVIVALCSVGFVLLALQGYRHKRQSGKKAS